MSDAEIGVFGGSGFYSFLDDAEDVVVVDTPYGPTSDRFVIGDVGGKRVAFLPRHGRNHQLPPHAVPYRANLWALRALGVRRIFDPEEPNLEVVRFIEWLVQPKAFVASVLAPAPA